MKFLNDLMKQSQRVKPVIRIDRERLLSLENMTFKDSTYKSIDINLDYCKNSLEYMKYDFLKLKTFIIGKQYFFINYQQLLQDSLGVIGKKL